MKLNVFCVTDGRAWYKQIITGIYKACTGVIVAACASLGLLVLYGVIDTYGIVDPVLAILSAVVTIIVILFVLVVLLVVYGWASDEL